MTAGAGARWRRQIGCVGFEEILCMALFAFFAMDGAIAGIAPHQSSEMTGIPPTGLMKLVGIGSQLLVNFTIVGLVVRYARDLWRNLFALQWAAAIAAFAMVSAAWSQDPALTARRAIPFGLAALFGLYFATRFPVRRQLSILWSVLVLLSLATIVVAMCFPATGLDASLGHTHDWQGVFTQKNACGRAMVLATTVSLCLTGGRARKLVSFILFTSVLIMSGSRSAWIIDVALGLTWFSQRVVQRMGRRGRFAALAAITAVVIVGVTLGIAYLPELSMLLGRDSTLSGRTEIWAQVWTAIVKHPLLGYGLSAFWQGMRGESYNVILALHYVVFHAHNGLLEIWLELGGTGLVLFVLSYARAWRRLGRSVQRGQSADAIWMVCFLALIFVYNIDENTFLTFNGMFWIIYVSVIANIEMLFRDESHAAFEQAVVCSGAVEG